MLNGKVITALQYAMEPALEYCEMVIGTSSGDKLKKDLGTIFRNQLVHSTVLLSEDEFASVYFHFICKNDPIQESGVEFKFEVGDFEEIKGDDEVRGLF